MVDRNELFIYSRQLADCKIDKVTIQYTLSTGLKMEALLKCYEQELEEEKETEDKEDTRQRPERTYPTIRKSSKAYWKTV